MTAHTHRRYVLPVTAFRRESAEPVSMEVTV